jgi:hypothetical protein
MKSLWAVAVLAIALSVSACDNGQKGTDTGGPSTAAALPQITIVRTGGFAGVNDKLVIGPDGAWTATDKLDRRRSGQLTPDQIATVRALATAPALAAEAGRTVGPSNCLDAFNYAVTVGAQQVGYVDCPNDTGPPAATVALVTKVQQLTAGG